MIQMKCQLNQGQRIVGMSGDAAESAVRVPVSVTLGRADD